MPKRLPLSVIIIAQNEADRLPRTLASLSWVEQIVLVDSGSTDGTPDLARAAGADVFSHPWQGYCEQKSYALERTTHDWVLWIDADEVVSPLLCQSLQTALVAQADGSHRYAAYQINRRTHYLGRFVRFGGWYPDRKVRLFRKSRTRFDGRQVHEGLVVRGAVGRLKGDLWHYSYRDLDHHLRKTREMARLWAEQEAGRRRVSALSLALHPAAKVLKSFLLKGGFLEGWRGLVIAGAGGYAVWLKYALLRERQAAGGPGAGGLSRVG